MLHLYLNGEHDNLAKELLTLLTRLRRIMFIQFRKTESAFVNEFVSLFLFIMTRKDFSIPKIYEEGYIDCNPIIQNMVAISGYQTTDNEIRTIIDQKQNLVKILLLYGPRNKIFIDQGYFFSANPYIASRWYMSFLENYKNCCASEHALARLRQHIADPDDRLICITPASHHAYFGVTYVDSNKDYILKKRINESFKIWPDFPRSIQNRPRSHKIALITQNWAPYHSVYRSQYKFIESLKDDYEIDLIYLGKDPRYIDKSLFKQVKIFDLTGDYSESFQSISPNDYQAVYFPDIGMNIESILLANRRIAPIQISCYGHPSSTWGSHIDYWIGGQATECLHEAESFYSERLVLIPGIGQIPEYPHYHIKENVVPPDDALYINCSWSGQKICFDTIKLLRSIIDTYDDSIIFRFFIGKSVYNNGSLAMLLDMKNVIGTDNVEIFYGLDYERYMTELQRGHFSIDAYPFGGYNTVIDALYLRKPFIAWRGKRFYNRAAACLLEQCGLAEMIAEDSASYVNLIAKLAHDLDYRAKLVERVAAIDLEAVLFASHAVDDFRLAFDTILSQHSTWKAQKSRFPISISTITDSSSDKSRSPVKS